MLARFIPLVRASLLGAVVGACSLYTLYLSLAVVIYFISPSDHPFARAGHLGLSALPLAIAGGVIAGPFFFFRSSPAEPLRRAGRVCAAGALSLLFALCLRGAQCGYFALTVLRPSFPLGSPASQVVERLGKPSASVFRRPWRSPPFSILRRERTPPSRRAGRDLLLIAARGLTRACTGLASLAGDA